MFSVKTVFVSRSFLGSERLKLMESLMNHGLS